MAEVATVIQLLHFSGQVLTCCYEYIEKAKNAPKEIQSAIDELASLKALLERLQSIADDPVADRFEFLKSLNRENGPFQVCSHCLTELDLKLKALTEVSSAAMRLQWPLQSKGVEKIRKTLSDQKTILYTALTGDMAVQVESIRDNVAKARATVEEIQAEEQKSRILSWLSGPDTAASHNRAKDQREPGTCEWLLCSEDFKAWMAKESQIMWLHAFPGAGKTILTSAVIEYLHSVSLKEERIILSYYFDFRNSSLQTYSSLLRSLLRQICGRNMVPQQIVSLYEKCRGASPSTGQLADALRLILEQQPRTFIVIDALDECPETGEPSMREGVLDMLRVIKKSEFISASTFIASRPEADISAAMRTLCDIDIDIQISFVEDDIRRYVRSSLAKYPRLNGLPQNIKDEIEQKLVKDSGGMFQWISCQIDEIRHYLKPAAIPKALKSLPRGLYATYSRILEKVPDIYESEFRTILMLLAFSDRPMTIQEVAEATAVNLEQTSFFEVDRFPNAYDILAFCSSLVTLSDVDASGDSPLSPDVRIIQFAHSSVKEYLLSERTQKLIPARFHIDEGLSHSCLTQIGLIYLLEFKRGERVTPRDLEHFPFLPYAALHWTTHLAHVREEDRGAIEKLLLRLFDPHNNTHLLNFLNLYDPRRPSVFGRSGKELRWGQPSYNGQDFQPPLYYASYYGILPIVRFLLESLDENSLRQDILNAALRGAALGGHAAIVQILLSKGADPKSPLCGDLLSDAVSSGNINVVKMFVDAGSPICTADSFDGGALHAACRRGLTEAIQMLIDYGFDVHGGCIRSGRPLSVAVRHGEHSAVETLIRNNVDVNIPSDGYFNALNIACEHASVEIVRLLLDNGATESLKRPGSQALAKAAKRGNTEIMQLLLDHGGDINSSSNESYGTPLKGAIQSWQPKVLEYTLSKGADIHFRGMTERYPVDLALFSGNIAAAERLLDLGAQFGDRSLEEALDSRRKEYLVKILLDRGANPNAEHKEYGSVLQLAVAKSSPTAIQWLLDAGAELNDFCGGKYGTPLQAAARERDINVVRLLLGQGALVNPERLCGEYGDPLRAAARNSDLDLIHLLLDHGASLTRQHEEFATPLHWVAQQGLLHIVRLFVERGVNVNTWGGKYGTALRAAVANEHAEVVKFLLDHGASFTEETKASHTTSKNEVVVENYESALEVAAATNNTNLVQLLLDHGLDLNSSARSCSRALMRAAEMPDITMLQYLIDQGADVKRHGGRAVAMTPYRHFPGRLERIKVLLEHGADINGSSESSSMPLVTSIIAEEYAVLDLLLDGGCDVNASRKSGGLSGCALSEAIHRGATNIVEKLLAKGADPNMRAGDWGTPFMVAIMQGDEKLFHLLLEHGAEVNLAPPFGYYGTPLQTALTKGYYGIAHELIDRGADINAPGCYASPLTAAIGAGRVGQMAMIERLLSLGADVEAEDRPRPEDRQGDTHYTPLQKAVSCSRRDLVRLLIDKGAAIDPSPPRGTLGSPLQTAALHQDEDMVELLLDLGANVNAVGGDWGTAIQAAVSEVADNVITLLLDAGADVTLEGGRWGSPLQASARMGIKRYIQMFLDRGALINTNVGKYGNPLAAASKRAKIGIVQMLLDAGADVNQAGGKYGTPLQAACSANSDSSQSHTSAIIAMLLDRGADVNATGGKYGTALQAASYHDYKRVEQLLNHGADPCARGGKFGSPLNAAIRKKLFRAEKALRKAGAVNDSLQYGTDHVI
ncbi:uncharacterized protein Z518_08667 [Rhinocladiella mackenziei CBS 650.93]|uniref:NACHT domain-containing protein n=1 Tax=Rhinocladiella mackenziei CBS 650.93 TaxID=1442369 RepID=A0A0D2J1E6_9EURO|nr:uncharacterized protein Z518_08667 [Rhinocladiella mackenziei CBS 650.93]KIX02725.1 hypothetical protein Z518_08667 [Rhinocladiella mackenziei CBS 650.93]